MDVCVCVQDTLKDKNKCVKECKTALAAGQSAVIDNQNKDKSTRKAYIDLAKQYKGERNGRGQKGREERGKWRSYRVCVCVSAKVRAVYMDVPKELCFHLNAYRQLNPRVREHKQKIPPHGMPCHAAAPLAPACTRISPPVCVCVCVCVCIKGAAFLLQEPRGAAGE